jgi:hypothetical protein
MYSVKVVESFYLFGYIFWSWLCLEILWKFIFMLCVVGQTCKERLMEFQGGKVPSIPEQPKKKCLLKEAALWLDWTRCLCTMLSVFHFGKLWLPSFWPSGQSLLCELSCRLTHKLARTHFIFPWQIDPAPDRLDDSSLDIIALIWVGNCVLEAHGNIGALVVFY